jgi:hypothetical protein
MKPRGPRGLRDYGYGEKPKVIGSPEIVDTIETACPHCGCKKTFAIKVELASAPPQLNRPSVPHKIVGIYAGCAACAWASPMITRAEPTT